MATACWCLSAVSLPSASTSASQNQKSSIINCKSRSSICFGGLRDSSFSTPVLLRTRELSRCGVVCMAPDEEKMTRRSPLDFPISCCSIAGGCSKKEWERPKPGRRPDIFPKFSPMKTPLPTPLPADPPEEDEEEEEKKEEEEEDPEKEEEEDDKPTGV